MKKALSLFALFAFTACAPDASEPAGPAEVAYALEVMGYNTGGASLAPIDVSCHDGCCYQNGDLVGCYY
ncbi:MAG: hypothetical protein AAF645_24470 [Myxococcota bacterium]